VSEERPRKELNYQKKKEEILKFLEKDENAVMVLATSLEDRVMARNVLIVNDGLDLYFFTWGHSRKCMQIQGNPKVALCKEDVQIEGVAEILGGLLDEGCSQYTKLIRNRFPEAVEDWEHRPGMVVGRIRPTFIATSGEIIDDEVYVHCVDLEKEVAYAERWAYC
jgi:uncharacterized pyridoxamine 5'-phosphate oxidase family protein